MSDEQLHLKVPTALQPLANGETLEVQIRHPTPGRGIRGLALLAHPLGRLGGSLNDPVVQTLSHRLAGMGYRTVAFNSRGTGRSSGSPSFSGASECEDVQLLLGHCFRQLLEGGDHTEQEEAEEGRVLDVVVVGYSAGGLYASKLDLQRAFAPLPAPQNVAAKAAPCSSRRRYAVRFRLVLVSFPLDVMWALSFFRSGSYTAALDDMLRLPARADGAGDDSDSGTIESVSLLGLFGDQDQFTKLASYTAWADRLKGIAATAGRARVEAIDFPGVDHFWRSREALDALADRVGRWIEEGPHSG